MENENVARKKIEIYLKKKSLTKAEMKDFEKMISLTWKHPSIPPPCCPDEYEKIKNNDNKI